MNPKISIIIPILNAKTYIKECLDSVINQSLKDIEILCVDANSNDGTLEILKDYMSKDNRIKLIISDKKSMGYQYNLGIKQAKGEYIGFVESDDYIKENMYERLLSVAKEQNVEVVKGDILEFKDSRKKRIFKYRSTCDDKFYDRLLNPNEEVSILAKSTIMNQSGIYKLSFIKENDILLNETPGASYQDTGFFYQVFILAKSAYLIKEPFYMYRKDNPNSSVNDKTKVFTLCYEYEFIDEFLNKHKALKEKFNPALIYRKFSNYMWNFNRIDRKFQLDFLEKFRNEFKDLEASGKLDLQFFGPVRLREIKLLLHSKEEFYQKYLNGLSFFGRFRKAIYRIFRKLKTKEI